MTQRTVTKRTWYGRKYTIEVTEIDGVDVESLGPEKRPSMLYAPVYNGLCMGLAAGTFIFPEYSCNIDNDGKLILITSKSVYRRRDQEFVGRV